MGNLPDKNIALTDASVPEFSAIQPHTGPTCEAKCRVEVCSGLVNLEPAFKPDLCETAMESSCTRSDMNGEQQMNSSPCSSKPG